MITAFVETETIVIPRAVGFSCQTIDEARNLYSILKSGGYPVRALTDRDQFGNIIYKLYL